MANVDSPTNGQGLALPLILDQDNVPYLQAAGDPVGTPTGAANPAAPTLVQLHNRGTFDDASDTIASGAVAQTLFASNPLRRYVFVQNLDGAEDLWIKFDGTAAIATPGSILIRPYGTFVMETGFVNVESASVIATTTGHKYTAYDG